MQSIPTYSVTRIVIVLKSITERDISKMPAREEDAVEGEFWTDFASTVGKHGDEEMIGRYVKNQGKEYNKLHSDHQLGLF